MSFLDMYTGAEELGLEEVVTEVTDAVEETVRAEIAEVAVQVEEQSAAIEDLVEEVQEMDESVEELEEAVEGMESLLNSGNFNGVAFATLYNRGMKLNARLGGESHGSRLGAESISDAATAQMMARSGVEGFMDTVKSYAKKAVEFIKHIFNVVINFFVSLFNAADGIQKRAEQLKKKVSDAKEVKKDIKLGGWNVYFDYKANGLTAPGGKTAEQFKAVTVGVAQLAEMAKNVEGIDPASFKGKYSVLTTDLSAAVTAAGKANKKKAGTSDVVIGIMAGIRARASWAAEAPSELKDIAEAARSLKLEYVKDPESKKLASGDTKAKLDKAALTAACKEASDYALELRKSEVAKKFSAAERDRVVGTLNAVKASDQDKATEINKQIAAVRAIYGACASITQAISKHTTAVMRAKLDGVAAHI